MTSTGNDSLSAAAQGVHDTQAGAARAGARTVQRTGRWMIVLLVVAAISFGVKIAMSLTTYGTNDMLVWEANVKKIRSDGPLALYRDGAWLYHGATPYYREVFNHPPFMVYLLAGWDTLARVSGLPLRFWLRFSNALADLGVLILFLRTVRRPADTPLRRPALLMLAASPASIMIGAFHGNTDPLMMAFLVLSLALISSNARPWLAGAAFGMAMNIKIVPVIFFPAFCLFLPDWKRRAQFVLGLAVVFVGSSAPILFQDPALVLKSMFGYKSNMGLWGTSRLAVTLLRDSDYHWLYIAYVKYAKWVTLGLVTLASVLLNMRSKRPSLLFQCGLVAFLFMFLTPGFGVQYLAWLVPWTATLTIRQAIAYHVTSGLFLFSYYDFFAGGFPWYLADTVGAMAPERVAYLGLLCWLVVGCLTIAYGAAIMKRAPLLETSCGRIQELRLTRGSTDLQ